MNLLLFTLLLSIGMQAQPSTRKLLLFGKVQAEHREQLALLEQDSTGMTERDLVIIIIEKESEYRRYNVAPNQFTLLLIGKDGGEKLRSDKPVETEVIFKLIDSMPMRQAEISRKKTN